MQRLILFRHGEAHTRAASGRDFDRTLTLHGQVTAARTAAALREAGAIPDIALVSNANRTTQTWGKASEQFEIAQVEFKPGLYNASAEAILDLARRRSEGTVMVV